MGAIRLTLEQVAAMAILANGVIPADRVDDGAASVDTGSRLAARVEAGVHAALYLQGLETAAILAQEVYDRPLDQLTDIHAYDLLIVMKPRAPHFYKQLRADVSALYLSDPDVWARIGFPGPSTAQGGYPDFDQPPREEVR